MLNCASTWQSGHSVPYSCLKKKTKKKPNHLPPEHQCWWVGGFSASVNTRLMKHPTLCRDGRTSSLGHGHSLWQITCSRLYLAAHMEDPRWDRVLCRPSLTPLASAQPLSTVYHTTHWANTCWKLLVEAGADTVISLAHWLHVMQSHMQFPSITYVLHKVYNWMQSVFSIMSSLCEFVE